MVVFSRGFRKHLLPLHPLILLNEIVLEDFVPESPAAARGFEYVAGVHFAEEGEEVEGEQIINP